MSEPQSGDRRELIKEGLALFLSRLKEKYKLTDSDIACTLLIVQAIGQHNLNPKGAADQIKAALSKGTHTFSYIHSTFSLTKEDFLNFQPNPDAFTDAYQLFHIINKVPPPGRMETRTADQRQSDAMAIVKAIIREARQ